MENFVEPPIITSLCILFSVFDFEKLPIPYLGIAARGYCLHLTLCGFVVHRLFIYEMVKKGWSLSSIGLLHEHHREFFHQALYHNFKWLKIQSCKVRIMIGFLTNHTHEKADFHSSFPTEEMCIILSSRQIPKRICTVN